jgi:branched-chain amino acid transport system permease protein
MGTQGCDGAGLRLPLGALVELLGPALLVVVVGLVTTTASPSNKIYFLNALVSVAIVVAIYVFVGISGVLSFGQISFVAVGAFAAGVMTVPVVSKKGVLTSIFPLLRDHSVGNVTSLLLAAALGGVFAFVVGIPLMRLSGLAAGIATFAVLGITYNVLTYEQKIGPGQNAFSGVPQTTGIWQAAIAGVICAAAAYVYQRTRFGRMLRATREDPAAATAAGISIYRQRLLAFTLSGALAGFAGGIYVHLQPLQVNGLYLDLTFITLAMLVVGGAGSLLGAVVGALALNGIFSFFSAATNTVDVFGWHLKVPAGTADIVLGVLMAVVLIVRPNGITGGREFSLPRRRRPVADLEKARATT